MEKIINNLVSASYTNNNMDLTKVQKIAGFLNRKLLKAYISALKRYEKKATVYIDLPQDPEMSEKKEMEALYPEKKIIYNTDPTLLAGVRITNDDIIYELSMKDSLNKILATIEQNYD